MLMGIKKLNYNILSSANPYCQSNIGDMAERHFHKINKYALVLPVSARAKLQLDYNLVWIINHLEVIRDKFNQRASIDYQKYGKIRLDHNHFSYLNIELIPVASDNTVLFDFRKSKQVDRDLLVFAYLADDIKI